MIDAPGPWGTGPFMVTEGHSIIDTEQVVIRHLPFAASWLWRERRAPYVRLTANTGYWDTNRGPHLREIIFRNDLVPQQALELVCATEGEVDIVTEVAPADAGRVENSEYARLVTVDPVRSIAGVINRDAPGLLLGDVRARRALNHAIDRDRLVREALFGYARPLAGLTPPAAFPVLERVLHPFFSPYDHDPRKAADLWQAAGGGAERRIRIAAAARLEPVARRVAADIEESLGVPVELLIDRDHEAELRTRRRLAEGSGVQAWDILILEQTAQAVESVAVELHRAFVGANGEYRAGPVVPAFERMYADLVGETNVPKQVEMTHRLDELVYNESLALFLCPPQALYAVNMHVDFKPYATTFELADTTVSPDHWSRR